MRGIATLFKRVPGSLKQSPREGARQGDMPKDIPPQQRPCGGNMIARLRVVRRPGWGERQRWSERSGTVDRWKKVSGPVQRLCFI